MVDLWEPDMNENIYREIFHELYRFPYLPDKYRNEATVTKIIGELFNATNSVAVEYPGGYLILRWIGGGSADLFWIHLRGRLKHSWRKWWLLYIEAAMQILGIHRLTMMTADRRVARIARCLGFKEESVETSGFVWHGKVMPIFHLVKEN